MKLYKDKELKHEVVDLDLGVVNAGGKKQFEFFVHNEKKSHLDNIVFEVTHPEVKIASAPKTLKHNEVGSLIVEWEPSVTLEEGLHTVLRVRATELWS